MENDKIILVVYINIAGLHDADVSAFVAEVANSLRPKKEENMLMYFIPVRETESRIECINPKLVSEEEYEKARMACEELTELVKKFRENEGKI